MENEQKDFYKLLQCSYLEKKIKEQGGIEYAYHKKDGHSVRVRIIAIDKKDSRDINSLWIFEKVL